MELKRSYHSEHQRAQLAARSADAERPGRQALDEQARDKLSRAEQKRSELAELERRLGRG
jgi:hypothetical protein